jgi:hypothetical protein
MVMLLLGPNGIWRVLKCVFFFYSCCVFGGDLLNLGFRVSFYFKFGLVVLLEPKILRVVE